MRLQCALLPLVLLSNSLWPPSAQDTSALRARLRALLVGTPRTLRGFYSASYLHYDSSRRLKNQSDSGPWTLDGLIVVDSEFKM